MKKGRKEELLYCFPPVSSAQMMQMNGKGAKNFVVFLTYGSELFARCYHRYSNGVIAERQRYVFAKDGCVRYGFDRTGWKIRSEFREPIFCLTSYGYAFDNSYSVIGMKNIDHSDMKYSQYNKYCGHFIIEYLGLYCKHPNLEYLMKQNFNPIEEYYTGYWGNIPKLTLSDNIDWKSNNMLKMLGLNKNEVKLLKGIEHLYDTYIGWKQQFPNLKPEEIIHIADVFRNEHGTLARFTDATGLTPQRMARYLSENKVSTYDYSDYIAQCAELQYDMHDTAISMPHSFDKMHNRLSQIIKQKHDEKDNQKLTELYDERKKLEFECGEYIIIQPKSVEEIVTEGRILSHCVGGYAYRHAHGLLNIMFLRKKTEPQTPYYTIEVSNDYKIIQCRGYKNNKVNIGGEEKPQEILEVEKQYQEYLDTLKRKAKKKSKIEIAVSA